MASIYRFEFRIKYSHPAYINNDRTLTIFVNAKDLYEAEAKAKVVTPKVEGYEADSTLVSITEIREEEVHPEKELYYTVGKKVRLIDSALTPFRPDLVGEIVDFSPSTMEVQVRFSSFQAPRWYAAELLEVIDDEV